MTKSPYTQIKFAKKCYCIMSTAIKSKSAITTSAFKKWTGLLQKGVLGTRKFGSKKKSKGRQTSGRIKRLLLVTKFL